MQCCTYSSTDRTWLTDAPARSTIFSFLAAAVVVGEMIASPLAYYLMGIDAWISIYSGLGCLVLGVLVTLILPETLEKPRYLTIDRAASSSWYHAARLELLRMGEAVLWVIWRDWTVVALLATFLLTTLGRFAQELLLQYVTKRYGWSWSQVRYSSTWLIKRLHGAPEILANVCEPHERPVYYSPSEPSSALFSSSASFHQRPIF